MEPTGPTYVDSSPATAPSARGPGAAAILSLVRGTVALALGSAILLYPDKAWPMLGNFIGIYWLVSGALCLRWSVTGERAWGLSLVAGCVGLLGGLLVLARFAVQRYVATGLVVSLLGSVAVLTGVLHMIGGFRNADVRRRQWSWSSFFLGLFEIVLGLLLVAAPLQRGPFLTMAACLWALLGGFFLVADAWWLSRTRREAP